MDNGLYHIQDNKIYEMSLNEPMKKIGVVASDEAIMNIIDTVICTVIMAIVAWKK